MSRLQKSSKFICAVALAGATFAASLATPAKADPDKVKVGVFPISSSLPYFVAIELGYFKDLNIEPETSVLMGGPPNVAALITNQIEVSAVLVTLEGLNADVKKPGVAKYIAMHSQTATYKMEQFVVRSGLADKVKTLADFKGLKLMSAPGPANVNTAKGILAKVGLKGRRLHHRSARYGPARQCDEGGHFRRRLYARACRHHHAQSRRRADGRGRRDREIHSRQSRRRRLRRRLRLHDGIHQ